MDRITRFPTADDGKLLANWNTTTRRKRGTPPQAASRLNKVIWTFDVRNVQGVCPESLINLVGLLPVLVLLPLCFRFCAPFFRLRVPDEEWDLPVNTAWSGVSDSLCRTGWDGAMDSGTAGAISGSMPKAASVARAKDATRWRRILTVKRSGGSSVRRRNTGNP